MSSSSDQPSNILRHNYAISNLSESVNEMKVCDKPQSLINNDARKSEIEDCNYR